MKDKKQIIRILIYIHKLDHSILPVSLLLALAEALTVYLNLFFTVKILDRLSQGNIRGLLIWLVGMVLFELLWGLLVDGLTEYFYMRCVARLEQMAMGETNDKAMTIDYASLEDPKQRESLSNARFSLQHSGGFGYFLMYCQRLFQYTFTILISGFVLLEFCLKQGDAISGPHSILFSRWIGLILILFVIAVGVLGNIYQEKRRANKEMDLYKANMEFEQRFTYYYREFMRNYSNGKTIRIYRMQKLIGERYQGFMKTYSRISKSVVPWNIRADLTGQVTSGLVSLCAYGVVALRIIAGAISSGSFLKYTGMINQLNWAVQSVIGFGSQLQMRCEFLKTYLDFLETPNRLETGSIPVEKRLDNEFEIEFHHVSFTYPGSDQPVLKDVNCKLDMKHKFAVVGRNGTGKTTFIKLLCRLYDPTEGSITLNGVDIRKYDYREYQSLFGVVFQDFALFSGTLAENVGASIETDQGRIWQCLELAGIREQIEGWERGINTPLYSYEEGGLEISGGEAQKLAIARALYRDAPFVILDEPTAALDPISEYEIYCRFQELVRDKTSIYISHRMSSCRFCDRIYVFDGGRIAEMGDHDGLMSQRGIYAELFEAQAKYYQSDQKEKRPESIWTDPLPE